MARQQVFKDRSGKWHYTLGGEESEGYRREDLARRGLSEALVKEAELAERKVEERRLRAQEKAARAESRAVRKHDKDAPRANPEDVRGDRKTK